MIVSLSEIAQFLADNGVFATVYDSYMDPMVPPHAILIETETDETLVMYLLLPVVPFSLYIIVRNPRPDMADLMRYCEPDACICIGPLPRIAEFMVICEN